MAMAQDPRAPRPFSLREMLEILFRDRRRIALAFAVTLTVFVLAALLVPSQYTSEARLLVRLGHEFVYVAESNTASAGAMPLAFSRDEALNAETEILSSQEVIGSAIDRVGLKKLYPALAAAAEDPARPRRDQAIALFREGLGAEMVEDSTVLRLSFRHRDPRMAQQALHALIDRYLERRRSVYADAHVHFLEEQRRLAGRRLAEAEARLADFKRRHGIVEYERQLALLLDQANEIELRLNDSNHLAESARARARKLRELRRTTPESHVVYSETLGDPQTPKLLLDLRLKEQGLSARYREANPLVRHAHQDVRIAEAFLSEQQRRPPRNVRTARNQVREQAELDLLRAASDESALAGGADALAQRLDALRRRAENLATQRGHLNVLVLEQKMMEESYGNYARKLEGARIDEAREQKDRTNVSVLQDASRPLASTSLRRPLLLVGAFFSVGVALLVALLTETLRSGFQLPVQLERKLGIPVLASLPVGRG